MADIRFVNYDGAFPNLCSGSLTIIVENRLYRGIKLVSGGRVWFDESWADHVEEGPWRIDMSSLPPELLQYTEQITALVNEHVPHGCCGGCV